MKHVDVAVVGAGPAGLAAAAVAAKVGARVLLVDENAKPGGQLFKQIHKFFGSKEHHAGVRGIDIGRRLLEENERVGAEIWLNSTVWGIFEKHLAITVPGGQETVTAEKIILATGARENPLRFPGWTLPGVMTAGAAQTMVNSHRVLPGRRVIMVGSGNVGLIVSYQLLQAGAEVVGLVEAAPKVGGYFVHAAKIARAGVPILISHTVKEAIGEDEVEAVTVVALDDEWCPIYGSERTFQVDLVCVAVGLAPQVELAWMCGCEMCYSPVLGGHVPVHDANMETSVPGVYVAGDAAGVEEASTAMEEGRIAGISAAEALGFVSHEDASEFREHAWRRLTEIRSGPFGDRLRVAKEKIVWRERADGASDRLH